MLMKNKLDFSQIDRYGITLRLVEENDAEFILQLRNDSILNKHLSPTSNIIDDQINWILKYKVREAKGLEYYFITIGPNGEKWGTTRLSELEGDCFELGSWLFSKQAPQGVSIKADILTKEIGFDLLNFESCKFNVRKANKSVLKYHMNFRPTIVDESEIDIFFNLSKENFIEAKKRFIKIV